MSKIGLKIGHLRYICFILKAQMDSNTVDMSWHTFTKWGKCMKCKKSVCLKKLHFSWKHAIKWKHTNSSFTLWLKLRESTKKSIWWLGQIVRFVVSLLGKSLDSWAAEIERSGLSSRFISLFTTFLQQEKRFIVKLCFCRLTCLECQKKNHGDPKPVFPLGHPHTSSETNYFQRPTSCKDRSTKK